MFPLFLAHKVQNMRDDLCWKLYLLLREIVDLACAPNISANMAAYLTSIIEYLLVRHDLFPNNAICPEHHYLLHYDNLMLQFGPLIRVWTLHFEAKHSYFKECARKLYNFKNLCLTLSERHQMLQAYLDKGNLFHPSVQVEKRIDFYVSNY